MMGIRFSLAPLMAMTTFAASAGVVWLAHVDAGEMMLGRQPPLVKASTAPLKSAPSEPGGRAVADLGGVGELLRDPSAETEERLLPNPEQPSAAAESGGVDANAALEALVSEIRGNRSNAEDEGSGAGGPNPDEPVSFPSPSRPGENGGIETQRSVATLEPPVSSSSSEGTGGSDGTGQTQVAAITPTFEATAAGRFRVQLAAVREEEDAERAWDLFQSQLGPFITGLQPFFERAETSNGVFYRVQVGPFGETAEADRLCEELKKQDASCFVVSR